MIFINYPTIHDLKFRPFYLKGDATLQKFIHLSLYFIQAYILINAFNFDKVSPRFSLQKDRGEFWRLPQEFSRAVYW